VAKIGGRVESGSNFIVRVQRDVCRLKRDLPKTL
jgi:hypothetical protein